MNNKPRISIVVILGILFLILGFEAISQFSFQKNYTVNDGLPSSKIYHMIQDSKGYIWFATENGVSRFDGYDFRNFTAKDGLPTNSTLKLYEDYKGRIWFSSFTGQISYYDNGKITEFLLNQKLQELNISFFDHIFVDSSDNLTLTAFNGGMIIINQKNEFVHLKDMELSGGAPRSYLVYFINKTNCTVTSIIYPDGIDSVNEIMPYKEGTIVKFYDDTRNPWFQKYSQKLKSNESLVSLGPKLKKIHNNKVILNKRYENNVIALFEDWKSNIWVSEEFKGVYMYPGGDLNQEPIFFLKNKSVSKILQDFEGNYWFSTTENGVYLVPSIVFRTYENSSLSGTKPVLSMVTNQEKLFYSTINKGIYAASIVNGDFIPDEKFQIEGYIVSNISDIIISFDNSLWITTSEYLKYDFSGKRKELTSNRKKSGYVLLELRDSTIVMAQEYGYLKYAPTELLFNTEYESYNKKTLAMLESPDSTLWLGSLEGLFVFKNGQYSRFRQEDEVLNSRISDIKLYRNQIFVGTFDNGLAVISSDSITYITEADGLTSNRIKMIYTDQDTVIWVGTNKGLNQIVMKNEDSFDFIIEKFTIWDGLPSNEINDIVKIGNQIWLGTDNGISSFYPEELHKLLIKPMLQIEDVLINDTNTIYLKDITELRYNENDFLFKFKALNYKNPGNINYLYKLDGLENDWISTKNTSVRYADLAPASYKFIVKAESIDGVWSDVIEYGFKINKRFTQTVLFIFLLVFSGLGLIGFVFWIILKNQKNKETLKQQVILAEQKAIRSQMNPHFLFNSLNSIQHLILNKEGEVANYYLTNLSKLMRRILDNSKYTTIPLKDELENIRLYLDLEKFRFENHFDYKIAVCDTIKIDEIVIPSMIIQPYLENAIWHGLVPKEVKGKLLLNISLNDQNNLLVVIEDNGIGQKEAQKIAKRRKNYKSMGMKNTKERMTLLNRLFNTHYNVDVIDLINNNNEPLGTRVELTLDT